MENKVIVINADEDAEDIQDVINDELADGWLIELFYEARSTCDGNKIIVTLYRENKINA